MSKSIRKLGAIWNLLMSRHYFLLSDRGTFAQYKIWQHEAFAKEANRQFGNAAKEIKADKQAQSKLQETK